MTSTISLEPSTAEVLKQDSRGRVRTAPARREALLDEFERSAMTGAKFAKLAGVKYATFANWVQKRRRDRPVGEAFVATVAEGSPGRKPVQLLEAIAEVAGSPGGCGLPVELPGGARLEIQSPLQLQMVAELLRLLSTGGGRGC